MKNDEKRPRKVGKNYDGKTPMPDPRQELFCVLFTTNTLPNFWAHGQNSYSFAYGHDTRIEAIQIEIDGLVRLSTVSKSKRKGKSIAQIGREIQEKESNIESIRRGCRASAPRLLADASIKIRCGHLLDQLAVHMIVDRELVYLIQQRQDLTVKVRAIEHHDKREQRVRDKVDLKHEFTPIEGFNYVVPEPTPAPKKK